MISALGLSGTEAVWLPLIWRSKPKGRSLKMWKVRRISSLIVNLFGGGACSKGSSVPRMSSRVKWGFSARMPHVLRHWGSWLRAGHPERALAALETALLGKRTPVDTFFFIGEAHRLLDNPTEATAAWTTCLAKSRSNRPAHVKWCNIRLEK